MKQHDEVLYKLAEEFARQARNGDEYAFTQLVELCGAFVYRYIARRIDSVEDAKEICNDVFQRLYNKLDTWDESIPIIAVIYKIASGKVIDWLRMHDREYFIIRKGSNGEEDKTRRFLDMGKEDVIATILALPDTSVEIGEALEHSELMQAIYSDVNKLPENQKEILKRILENQEPDKIAAIMGISISTVRSQYFHAKEKLKQNVRKYQLLSAMAFLDVSDNPISAIEVPADLSAQIVESVATKTAAATTTTTTAATTATVTATTTTAATAAASQTTIGGLGVMANVIGTKIGVAVITAAVAAAGVGVPMYITAEHRQAEQAAVIEQEQQARQGLEIRLAEIEQKLSTEQAARQEIETKLTQTADAYEAAQTEAQEMTAQIETLQAANETMQEQIDAEKAAQAEAQVLSATNIPQQAQQPPPQQSSGAASSPSSSTPPPNAKGNALGLGGGAKADGSGNIGGNWGESGGGMGGGTQRPLGGGSGLDNDGM